MARRALDAEVFVDEWAGSLPDRQFRLWVGLITACADDQGRMLDNAARIRAQVFPYSDLALVELSADLDDFVAAGKVHRYEVDGRRCLQLVNWWKHQRSQWAQESKLPAPDGWTDKVRFMQSGKQVTRHWKEQGGFPAGAPAGAPSGRPARTPSWSPNQNQHQNQHQHQNHDEPNGSSDKSAAPDDLSTASSTGSVDDDAFERFWTAYPEARQVEKGRARRAWDARLKGGTSPDDMTAAAGHYADYHRRAGTEPQYIKHPATFIGPDKPFEEWVAGIPAAYVHDCSRRDKGRSSEEIHMWAELEREREDEDVVDAEAVEIEDLLEGAEA